MIQKLSRLEFWLFRLYCNRLVSLFSLLDLSQMRKGGCELLGLMFVSVQSAIIAFVILFFVAVPILTQTISPIRMSAVATATAPSPIPMARMLSALAALVVAAASMESLKEFKSGWSSLEIQLLFK